MKINETLKSYNPVERPLRFPDVEVSEVSYPTNSVTSVGSVTQFASADKSSA